ncbi:MAG: alpha-amylase family glycosyl hydrolase [Paludibacteraceae bacterium]|nr:alpha-amylase family glycosyl hydrolase [Paludibacteraceae bacterium]
MKNEVNRALVAKKHSILKVIGATLLLYSSTPLLLTSCAPKAPHNPIMPIHLTGDMTTVLLTDYIPGNPDTIFIEGNKLNVIRQGETDIVALPQLPVEQAMFTTGCEDKVVRVGFSKPVTNPKFVVMIDNITLDSYAFDEATQTLTINLSAKQSAKRSFLRVYAVDEDTLFNDILIPLEDGCPITNASQLNRHDDNAQVLYSLLVDRFNNGNKDNDWKINSPEVLDIVDYQGGDLAGITAKIEDGFFDSLGITTLWVSPITQNPWTAWGHYEFKNGNKYDDSQNSKFITHNYTKYTGYHGYWPIFGTVVEQRFGTPDELTTLLNTAHAHEMNVILDYVANHMHIESPTYVQHPDWHTDSILPDGRRNFELWDEARLTTWFDVHIPTLDLEREEVYQAMTDTALYWLENYDFDGFRHDACKHIPECYWRTLGAKIAERFPDRHIWMIGETYGSPELINIYIKTGMLNAQFDFNVYYTILHALMSEQPMSDIDRTIRESLATYGAHHTMGNISGNHDQARFASIAGGALAFTDDAKEEGWTREVGIGDAEKAYRLTMLQEMINFTIPGVPCVYQGDEYAQPGGNDPDNRHMMRFEGLNEDEQAFRAKMQELIHLRRTCMPLIYGDYIPVYADENTLEFNRVYMGQVVNVKINRNETSTITVDGTLAFSL